MVDRKGYEIELSSTDKESEEEEDVPLAAAAKRGRKVAKRIVLDDEDEDGAVSEVIEAVPPSRAGTSRPGTSRGGTRGASEQTRATSQVSLDRLAFSSASADQPDRLSPTQPISYQHPIHQRYRLRHAYASSGAYRPDRCSGGMAGPLLPRLPRPTASALGQEGRSDAFPQDPHCEYSIPI